MFENKRILIVDDDDNMRNALYETIKRMGISADTACDGSDGFNKAMGIRYDLIISDIRMPKIDGIKFMEMLKSSGIDTPICFITAHGTVENAIKAMKEGAFDFILKPFPLEVIEEMVRRVFEIIPRKSPVSEIDTKIVFNSSHTREVFAIARDVAESEATVLITGESGTGKEVVARFIHENSKRKKGEFVAINCAAIPETLIESELFGFEKGAFTGANSRKIGKFELANGGTLLLDEIGEVPIHLQAKLLRVLQEKEIERLGSNQKQKIDTRIIATTNKNLEEQVKKGEFRSDLFYRLNVISIELPALRKRRDDIIPMANFFISKYSKINSKKVKEIAPDAINALLDYDWPGNVRELEHTIERAIILSKGEKITQRDLFLHGITFREEETPKPYSSEVYKEFSSEKVDFKIETGVTISEMEKELILKTLKSVDGNKTKTAEILGITVRTLRNKLNEYRQEGVDLSDID